MKYLKAALGAFVPPLLFAGSISATSLSAHELRLSGASQPGNEYHAASLEEIAYVDSAGFESSSSELSSLELFAGPSSFTLDSLLTLQSPFPPMRIGERTHLASPEEGRGMIEPDSSSIASFLTSRTNAPGEGSFLGLLPANIKVLIGFSLGNSQNDGTDRSERLNSDSGAFLGNGNSNGPGLVNIVPEPATFALLLSGLLLTGAVIEKRRSARSREIIKSSSRSVPTAYLPPYRRP